MLAGLPGKKSGQGTCSYATAGHSIKRPSFLSSPRAPPVNDEETQTSLVNSIEEFEQLAEQGKADVNIARSFLVKSMERLKGLAWEKQREEAAKVGAGRLLSWLWKYREEDTRQEDLDRYLPLALCWHLTAEGREDFIWKWLQIEAANVDVRTRDTQWNGRLLAGMVAAQLYWDRAADGAIVSLLSASKEFGYRIHITAASGVIHKALVGNGCGKPVQCSAASFDKFVDGQKIAHNGVFLAQTRATLMLFHPSDITAMPLLQYFRQQSQYPEQYPIVQRASGQQSQATQMTRASYVLRLQ